MGRWGSVCEKDTCMCIYVYMDITSHESTSLMLAAVLQMAGAAALLLVGGGPTLRTHAAGKVFVNEGAVLRVGGEAGGRGSSLVLDHHRR